MTFIVLKKLIIVGPSQSDALTSWMWTSSKSSRRITCRSYLLRATRREICYVSKFLFQISQLDYISSFASLFVDVRHYYFNALAETKTSIVFVMPVGCRLLEIPALAVKSVLKPQSLPELYQTNAPNAGIMLTSVTWLAAKSETVDTGSTFRAGSNTLRFANYFASGTGEDNAGTEMTEVSTSGLWLHRLRSKK